VFCGFFRSGRKRVASSDNQESLETMIVGVHPLAGFDKLLHYRVPEALRDAVRVGSLVRVPIINRCGSAGARKGGAGGLAAGPPEGAERRWSIRFRR
jgi:hypothetical protein